MASVCRWILLPFLAVLMTAAAVTVAVPRAGAAVTASGPVLSGVELNPLGYPATGSAVPVTSALAVSDATDATLSGATVSVTSGFAAAYDDLLFTEQDGITDTYDSATGMLTLTGDAPLAGYQTALRSVYFTSSDASASPAPRTVSFTVTDSFGATSNAAARTIDVTEVAPPTAYDVTATAGKNTAIDINVLGNATDPSGLPLTVAAVNTAATVGVVTVSFDGTIHYNPNGKFAYLSPGQTATDTFSYAVTDGTRTSNFATVTVIVTGVLPGY